MEDIEFIEFVIKMPKEMYDWINDVNKFYEDYGVGDFIDLIKNGTPLPKGYGRLIDANFLMNELNSIRTYSLQEAEDIERFKRILLASPTIIEADRSEENGNDD